MVPLCAKNLEFLIYEVDFVAVFSVYECDDLNCLETHGCALGGKFHKDSRHFPAESLDLALPGSAAGCGSRLALSSSPLGECHHGDGWRKKALVE